MPTCDKAAEVVELYKRYGFSIARRVPPHLVTELFSSLAGTAPGAPLAHAVRFACRAAIEAAERQDLLAALSRCNGDTAAIAQLAYLEKMPPAQIASLLSVPPRLVDKTLKRLERATGKDAGPTEAIPDLTLERYLVGDLPPDERAQIREQLAISTVDRQRLDVLLKRRLIFLADNPPARFAAGVVSLAAQPATARPRRRVPRWLTPAAAATATTLLLTVTLFTQAESTPASSPPRAEPKSGRVRTVAPAPAPALTAEAPAVTAEPGPTLAPTPAVPPEPAPSRPADAPGLRSGAGPSSERTEGSDAKVRFMLFARSGGSTRPLHNQDELRAGESIVPWVKLRRAEYVAVLGKRPSNRIRVYAADAGAAIAAPEGGPTRLSKAKPLRPVEEPTTETLLLLSSPEPFAVRPLAAELRRGADIRAIFDGDIRRLRLVVLPSAVPTGD